MSEPEELEQETHFLGFAGQAVPTPGREVVDIDPLAGMYGETKDYFRGIGHEHVGMVVDELMRLRREPQSAPAFDLSADVRDFRPFTEWNLGGEYDFNAFDYASGFTVELVEEANRIREALEAEREGQPYELALYGYEVERLGTWVADFAQRRGDLPAVDLLALADQLDDLARAIAANVAVELPGRLIEVDQRRDQETRDRIGVAELTAAIDEYSTCQVMPYLFSADPARYALTQSRLAVRIAILDGHNPHLIASLTADRASVIHDLLPDAADRKPAISWPPPIPPSAITAPDRLESLRTSAQVLASRLLHIGTQMEPHSAQRAQMIELFTSVAAHVRADPLLVGHLPTVQAGVLRHIAAQLGGWEQQPRLGDAADHVPDISTGHTAAQPGGVSRPVRSGLTQLPGTAGTHHAATQPHHGSGRIR
jgi:hypothetical protein